MDYIIKWVIGLHQGEHSPAQWFERMLVSRKKVAE